MKYVLFLIFLFLVACSATRNFSGKGEELYYEKCSGCHMVHNKGEHSAEEWNTILKKMSGKAHLNEAENRMIINYLTE